jgi:4-amino-4-deoxy-L-arabinose transferase-like glycosyltransferase
MVGVFLLISVLVCPLALGLSMKRGLSHDEHQHIAAGALIAREGLLPYRDFPYFHTPYLAFAYAGLFRITDHLLTSARVASVLCATGLIGMIGTVAFGLFRPRGVRCAVLVCAASVLLTVMSDLFTQSSGVALNHDPGLFLTVLAFLAHIAGLRGERTIWFIISGILLGLAIGTRITCAPLMAPFGLALWLYPTAGVWRWRRVFAFSGGLLLGMAGLIYLAVVAPEQTYFGNIEFAKINIIYRFAIGEPRTMTVLKKLRFFFKVILRPDFGLFLAALLPLLGAYFAHRGTRGRWRFELRFTLLALPFVLLGSFAPSPLFDQYFYPLVPFFALIGLFALASVPAESPWFRRTAIAGLAATVLNAALGMSAYREILDFLRTDKWDAEKLHRNVMELRAIVPAGKILTVAPVYPLEAGLPIYPEFTTGPIAWRVAPYVDEAKAVRLHMPTPDTLESLLQGDPPAAVMVGYEKTGEELLTSYAKRHGYRKVPFGNRDSIWVRRGAE